MAHQDNALGPGTQANDPAIAGTQVTSMLSVQKRESWRSDTAQSFDHPVLFWVTRGQGRFMLDCRMRGIGANTVVYIPPDALFSYEMFAQPQGMFVTLPQNDAFKFPDQPLLVKVPSLQAQAEFNAMIDTLARELTSERTGRNRAINAQIMLISVWLDRMRDHLPEEKLRKSDKVLRRFSRVVSIGHRDGKTLGEFAADLNVTPTHLTRLTQNSVGKPASALLQERVIHAACDALRRTDTPVQDVARNLGFSSAAYFTRAFQHHTGLSPTAFRKSQRK
ncbi:MAG: AraC family transcriptional regulator [Pseudomonadota bacterium]